MSEITADTLFNQAASLPVREKRKLFELLRQQLRDAAPAPDVKFVEPIPLPDPEPSRRWMEEHASEYGAEWVALDGDRLIAHGIDADAVFAAADADGAYLPLVTFILPADAPPFAGV